MHDSEHKIFLSELGNRIKHLRLEQGLTRVQLAFEIESSVRYVLSIEKGEKNIGCITIFKIAKALNVPIQSIFDFNAQLHNSLSIE